MNEPLLILGMMAVTVAVRYPPLVLLGRFRLPAPVARGLKFVPVAVLTAICAPEVLSPGGEIDLSYSSAHLVAGAWSVAVAWRTRNLLVTIVFGMAVFFAWDYLF